MRSYTAATDPAAEFSTGTTPRRPFPWSTRSKTCRNSGTKEMGAWGNRVLAAWWDQAPSTPWQITSAGAQGTWREASRSSRRRLSPVWSIWCCRARLTSKMVPYRAWASRENSPPWLPTRSKMACSRWGANTGCPAWDLSRATSLEHSIRRRNRGSSCLSISSMVWRTTSIFS